MFSELTLLFLQLYTVVVLCYTYHKPDKPCEFHDNECVTKMIAEFFRAAVNPDPSKGFEAIDPMHQDLVVANLRTINFTLKDSTVLGLSNLQVPSASLSDHDSVYVTLLLPYYEMFGMYEINGVFQNMPLKGNGHYSIKAKPDKPCLITDNACVTDIVSNVFTAAINGDQSEGYKPTDPMHHDLVVSNIKDANFTLKDTTVKGFNNLKIVAANISGHDSTYLTILLPQYEQTGMYELNGNFLNTPIMGSGHYTIKATDLKMFVEAMGSYYKKDDGIHLKLTSLEFTTELMGDLHVDIDNLFNGNKEKADAALKLLNSNAKTFATLWSPPITKANLDQIFFNINKVHEGVRLNDFTTENLSTKTLINN